MGSAPREGADIPKEFQSDPTLMWAASIAADFRLHGEASYAHFLELRERYVALLRRFAKIARISDGFQLSLKELNLLLSTDARTDYLTGLSNRRDIVERLEGEISRTHRHRDPFSLIIVDIDRFKEVNDSHGHEAGDRLLEAVALALRASLRLEDYCARWGGEEFLICLTRASLEGALVVAEKLRSSIESLEIDYQGARISRTISLGVAQYTDGESLDEIVRGADRALIEAKQAGRNRVRARPWAAA